MSPFFLISDHCSVTYFISYFIVFLVLYRSLLLHFVLWEH